MSVRLTYLNPSATKDSGKQRFYIKDKRIIIMIIITLTRSTNKRFQFHSLVLTYKGSVIVIGPY